MAKVDLGVVGLYPWTDIEELYSFPVTPNITAVGGYKVKDGVCYLNCYLSATGNASVTLPAFKSDGINNTVVIDPFATLPTTTASSTRLNTTFSQCINNEIFEKALIVYDKALANNTFGMTDGEYVYLYGCYETSANDT